MFKQIIWIKYKMTFITNLIPEGAYVSEEKVFTGNGSVPLYMIYKREDGLWATMVFENPSYRYVPFISSFQTKEVRPQTGLFKTLADAKDGVKISKRFR